MWMTSTSPSLFLHPQLSPPDSLSLALGLYQPLAYNLGSLALQTTMAVTAQLSVWGEIMPQGIIPVEAVGKLCAGRAGQWPPLTV